MLIISQTRRRPVGNVVGTDTGLEGVETRWVSGAFIASKDREMASDLSRREASGDRTMLPLQTNGHLIEEEQKLSAAVMIGGNIYKATIDTGATASFVRKEMADNIAALGRITRTRRQVRWPDGRCDGSNEQLEVQVKFGNKQVTMSLLILPGVVDPLVLGLNFLKQVETEIRCAGHEITIPARNRHNGWLEEKLSVAVVPQENEMTILQRSWKKSWQTSAQ